MLQCDDDNDTDRVRSSGAWGVDIMAGALLLVAATHCRHES